TVCRADDLGQALDDAFGLCLFPPEYRRALMLGQREPCDQVGLASTCSAAVAGYERETVGCFGLPANLRAPDVMREVGLQQRIDFGPDFRRGIGVEPFPFSRRLREIHRSALSNQQ